jgi:hypothetical protein
MSILNELLMSQNSGSTTDKKMLPPMSMLAREEEGEVAVVDSITGQGLTTLTRDCDTKLLPFAKIKPLKHCTSNLEELMSGDAGNASAQSLLVQIEPFPRKTSISSIDLNN